jgi:hypothetical protein
MRVLVATRYLILQLKRSVNYLSVYYCRQHLCLKHGCRRFDLHDISIPNYSIELLSYLERPRDVLLERCISRCRNRDRSVPGFRLLQPVRLTVDCKSSKRLLSAKLLFGVPSVRAMRRFAFLVGPADSGEESFQRINGFDWEVRAKGNSSAESRFDQS